jgi:hypothetical protein
VTINTTYKTITITKTKLNKAVSIKLRRLENLGYVIYIKVA